MNNAVEPAQAEGGDARWVTYREFAKARGIVPEYAKKFALKQGWQRVPGRGGTNRVLVPVAWLRPEPTKHTPPRRRPPSRVTTGRDTATILAAIGDLHAAVSELRAAVGWLQASVDQLSQPARTTAPATPP